jgi:hypothetical protein
MRAARTETWEMIHVHDQFRREFAAIPDLVRGVPDGDTARATIVASHAQLVTDFLHNHHGTEDKLLWPSCSSVATIHSTRTADLFDELQLPLDEHLRDEEEHILPRVYNRYMATLNGG